MVFMVIFMALIFVEVLVAIAAVIAIRWISAAGHISRGTAATAVIALAIVVNWALVFAVSGTAAIVFGVVFWPAFAIVGSLSWLVR
jgi:hypothetical protein